MNLFALFGRSSRNRKLVTAAWGLGSILAAQWPSVTLGADAVALGANITFVATADGNPAPTFQWRKNGVAIPGATSAIFSLSNVTTADAAAYQVVASNEVGSAVSADEILVVETTPTGSTDIAPAIVTQPASSQTVVAGSSVSLEVSATGTPTPTFQWRKNGLDMAGATNETLTLGSVSSSDSATYVAIATNSAGSVASNPAVLVVTDPTTKEPPPPADVAPEFLTQPSASQSGKVGDSASFAVTVSGTPAPSLQWQKNGTPIAGATEATLMLSSLTLQDGATYDVVAKNIAGSVTSSPAVLTVVEVQTPPPPAPPPPPATSKPVIMSQPTSTQTVDIGTSATFSVVALGYPTPTYQWRKNGAKIAGATKSTFALSKVSTADAATYTVVASNSLGSVVSDNAVLLVQSAPKFTVQPVAQALKIGASNQFSVVVSAIPGAALQWHKDGKPIAGATSSVLLLSSVTTNDVGAYSVVAKNAVGTAVSDEAPLLIAQPPLITSQPVSHTVSMKSNVTFKASASGSPAPTFQWKKNGSAISGATQSTLDIKSANKSDEGEYMVEARNVAGWVTSKKVTLVVNNQNGKKSSEEEIVEGVVGGTSGVPATGLVNLSVRANAGAGNDGLIVGFVVDGSSSKSVLVRGVGPTLKDFGVTGALLDPQLALYSGAEMAASNDDWSTSDNAAQIVGTTIRVGAFSLDDQTSDAALMATLENGAYTVQLSGKDSASGVALVEVYDAAGSGAKLVNLSVRTFVGAGSEAPNVGFVVAGNSARKVMIRAVGPALSAFGVAGAIADPQLELFRGSTLIDQNDNWGGNSTLSATFAGVGAFGFADTGSRDAVLLATLEPGAYTVVVSGVNGTKGVGLVEVYDVP